MALMGGNGIKKPMGMKGLFNSLYGSKTSQGILADQLKGQTPEMQSIMNEQWNTAMANPMKKNMSIDSAGGVPFEESGILDAIQGQGMPEGMGLEDLQNVNPRGNTAGLAMANIKAHPMLSAGLGIGGAMNVAGLMDNDKIGGQLVGGIAGYGLPKLLGSTMGPAGMAMATLGGGALGSLYDKLRAKKELEQQQYQGMQY